MSELMLEVSHQATSTVGPPTAQARHGTPAISLKRILVPVDFSPGSGLGLRFAALLAQEFGAELDVLHAVEPPSYPDWGYAHLTIREEKLRRAAEDELPEFSFDCGVKRGLIHSLSTVAGDAQSAIVKAADDLVADLIVIGSHGTGALKHALLGSTAERVLRHAHCPVLVVREGMFRDKPSLITAVGIKRILVTTDFSSCSKTALPYAAALSRRFGAEILLTHVVPSSLPTELNRLRLALEQDRLIQGATDLLPLLRDAELDSGLSVELQVLSGNPAQEICKTAKENACDLIVIATHGNTGLKHFWLGSVAERVVRHAPCPVLVVRQREHDFLIPPDESAINE